MAGLQTPRIAHLRPQLPSSRSVRGSPSLVTEARQGLRRAARVYVAELQPEREPQRARPRRLPEAPARRQQTQAERDASGVALVAFFFLWKMSGYIRLGGAGE